MGPRSIAASSLFACIACTSSVHQPAEVVDSSGARFAWSCDKTGQCRPAMEADTPAPPACGSDAGFYGASIDRFVMISAACRASNGDWSTSANLERPLTCATDEDCPVFGGPNGAFECRNTLCQSRNTTTYKLDALDGESALELCFAPFARTDTLDSLGATSQQIESWVTSACPTGAPSCTLPLPAMCLQP